MGDHIKVDFIMRLLIAISISAIGLATICPLSASSPASDSPTQSPSDTLDKFGLINKEVPVYVVLDPSGNIEISGALYTLEGARKRLVDIGNANPAQPVLIVATDQVPPERIQKFVELCNAAHLTHIVRVKKAPVLPPPLPSQNLKPAR